MPRFLIAVGLAAALAVLGAPARAQVQPTSPVPSKSYVDGGLAAANSAVAAEANRATAAEQANASGISANATAIQTEKTRAMAAEAGLMPLPSALPACTAGSSVAPVPAGQPFRCGGLILIAQ